MFLKAPVLRPRALGLLGLVLGSCGAPGSEGYAPLPPARAGYLPEATRVSVPIGDGLSKQCHGTLVASTWVLTAAHCFSGVPAGAQGYLRDFGRGFEVSAVRYHPEAHRAGTPPLDSLWGNDAIDVAHDLALIPFSRGVALPVAQLWPADPQDQQLDLSSQFTFGSFSRRSAEDTAETAFARLTGHVSATALLGNEHTGPLLQAESSGVYPGTSGSGLSVELMSDVDGEPFRHLVGVIQNANPDDPGLPFGVVPLYLPGHFDWLNRMLSSPLAP